MAICNLFLYSKLQVGAEIFAVIRVTVCTRVRAYRYPKSQASSADVRAPDTMELDARDVSNIR